MEYVPERIIKSDNILNKIMLSFNILVPALYGSFMFANNYFAIEKGDIPSLIDTINRCSNILAVVLQIISGVFLFYALFKIKQFITKEDR